MRTKFKNKKNKPIKLKTIKKIIKEKTDDEIALWPLFILDTNKSLNNCVNDEIKNLIIKYNSMYSPIGPEESLGCILFPSRDKRNKFYEESKVYIDIGIGRLFIYCLKKYVSNDLIIEEAEEDFKKYCEEIEKEK